MKELQEDKLKNIKIEYKKLFSKKGNLLPLSNPIDLNHDRQ